jgi:hypothetical protein
MSDKGAAHAAGTLAIINRSIGVDQRSLDATDYTADPNAITWPNEAFFQHSIQVPFPQATGKLDGTQGAFAHPAPLPNAQLLVSYAPNVQNLGDFSGNFDIYVVDPVAGRLDPLLTDANDLLWPVAVYARQDHGIFRSRVDEPNGHTYVDPGRSSSEVTVVDFPLLASLLFQNTRTGRRLPQGNPPFEVWESLPPEPGVTSIEQAGMFRVTDAFGDFYARRQLLGQVAPFSDGSAKIELPGGVPIVLATDIRLAGEEQPQRHHQREEMQFYPGEVVHQAFRRDMFNGLCGGCHGSVSGLESHIAIRPDILTSASNVAARSESAVPLLERIGGAVGPPFP